MRHAAMMLSRFRLMPAMLVCCHYDADDAAAATHICRFFFTPMLLPREKRALLCHDGAVVFISLFYF